MTRVEYMLMKAVKDLNLPAPQMVEKKKNYSINFIC